MKIEAINQPNFTASVDNHFVKCTKNYYMKRCLPTQYKKFCKKVDAFEYFGDEKSEIVYKAFPQEDGSDAKFLHLLCLKNTNLNKKQAVILTKTTKFRDLLDFFENITDNAMQQYEEALKNIK